MKQLSIKETCITYKNKTVPAGQFATDDGFSSQVLACEVMFPHSQKSNDNSTWFFSSLGALSIWIGLQSLSEVKFTFRKLSPPSSSFVLFVPWYLEQTQKTLGENEISLYSSTNFENH